ncbi:MAG: LacI family DNA-binding transcriptional regulator [Victivallis sp.]
MNIKEVAELAGVSVASISRAFQDPPSPYISKKQRERILKICEELQYYPDIHSQRLNAKRSNTIAFLSRHVAEMEVYGAGGRRMFDYNFGSVIMGAQVALAGYGKSLQLILVDDAYLAERRHLKMVRSRMVDGILIWGAVESDSYVTELLREKIPVVLLTTDGVPGGAGCGSVVADEYAGMSMLIQAALDAGHRRIAVLEPGRSGSAGAARMRAVTDTLGRAGIAPVWISPENGFNYEFGRRMTAELLKSKVPATCVVASNDMAAWGCISELRNAGLRVPEDMSVVGADGIPVPGDSVVDSFHLPAYEIGLEGARTLCRGLEGEPGPRRLILPVARVFGNTIRPLS